MSKDEYLELRAKIREVLGGADPTLFNLVTAAAGLLTAVAYADRVFEPSEQEYLKGALQRIQGIDEAGAHAITEVLTRDAVRISSNFLPRFTRLLVENAPESTRYEILTVLMEMAATDGSIGFEERTVLRNLTSAIGLSQDHYNELQAKYRELLSFHQTESGSP